MTEHLSSTMQDFQLGIPYLFRHGRTIHGDSTIVTWTDSGPQTATFTEVAAGADRLAAALASLDVGSGDRVGTFCWNNQRHLEAYLAVPTMGAVLHTLNIRLYPEQLSYVINHAGDRVIIVDGSIAPLLAKVRDELTTVQHVITVGEGDYSGLGTTIDYDDLVADREEGFDYPDVDERAAAAMCYTSGTTGNPKGVVYSHRSTYLHSFGVLAADALALSVNDRILVIVPMFHANAWGMPYAGWAVGSDMVLPQQYLQAGPLAEIIETTRPTYSGAVPTILNDLLQSRPDADLSSLREIVCGGSAVPASLIRGFDETFGVPVVQGWGMTETSPLAAVARVPPGTDPDQSMTWRARTGRTLAGVEIRICDDDGRPLPWNGEAQGEIEIRGPWITGGYHLDDTPEKFHDGWLRTGDVGSMEPNGFVQISDRAKDVIKSGGEWISSVDLENELMGHPEVVEAAVVAVPDQRWDERPLACVVLDGASTVSPEDLVEFLRPKVAKWWLPERWTFIDEVPKTSVGKFDKKVLRRRYSDRELDVKML